LSVMKLNSYLSMIGQSGPNCGLETVAT
jgi:hypothetical protein